MSRAYGWNASLLIAEETEYGLYPKAVIRRFRLFHPLWTVSKAW